MKRILLSFAILFAVVISLTGATNAPRRPAETGVCTGGGSFSGCVAIFYWNPGSAGAHGAETQTTVDNPGGAHQQSYYKYLESDLASGAGFVQVGIVKDPGFCGSTVQFFWNVNGSTGCIGMDSRDINRTAVLQLSWYTSNGGGVIVYFRGNCGSGCADQPCGSGCFVSFPNFKNYAINQTNFNLNENNSDFSGHEIWGGHWNNNEVFSGTTWTWLNIPNTPDWNLENDNGLGAPPDAWWFITPKGSQNNGGDAHSCVYDTSGFMQCTIGS